jgi:hypothetical protein
VSVLGPDGTVNLTPRECALILLAEPEIVGRWRRDGMESPELLAALRVMREAAAVRGLARPAHRGVVPVVSQVATVGFVTPESVAMTTVQAAADKLQISEQAVRKGLREGRLSGSRTERGAWEITAESVDRYVPRSRPSEGEPMTDSEFQAVKAELLGMQAEIEQLEADVRELAAAA